MIAEGKVICPWCGQAEIVKFTMGAVWYHASWEARYRQLRVEVEGPGTVAHNCPADRPAQG